MGEVAIKRNRKKALENASWGKGGVSFKKYRGLGGGRPFCIV